MEVPGLRMQGAWVWDALKYLGLGCLEVPEFGMLRDARVWDAWSLRIELHPWCQCLGLGCSEPEEWAVSLVPMPGYGSLEVPGLRIQRRCLSLGCTEPW